MENQNNHPTTSNMQHHTVNAYSILNRLKEFAKKPWFWIAVISIITVIIIIAAFSSKDDVNTPSKSHESDYKLEIVDSRLMWDSISGDVLIAITYNFTNNSDEPISFMSAFDDGAYIDGVSLSQKLGYDNVFGDYYKEVLNGASAEIRVYYKSNHKRGPVQIIVKEAQNKSNILISETFKFDWDDFYSSIFS